MFNWIRHASLISVSADGTILPDVGLGALSWLAGLTNKLQVYDTSDLSALTLADLGEADYQASPVVEINDT